jgi:hypothetical protein
VCARRLAAWLEQLGGCVRLTVGARYDRVDAERRVDRLTCRHHSAGRVRRLPGPIAESRACCSAGPHPDRARSPPPAPPTATPPTGGSQPPRTAHHPHHPTAAHATTPAPHAPPPRPQDAQNTPHRPPRHQPATHTHHAASRSPRHPRPPPTPSATATHTYTCTNLPAVAGGASPHNPSIKRAADTDEPTFNANIANNARGFPPPRATNRPSTLTSTGPRTRTSIARSPEPTLPRTKPPIQPGCLDVSPVRPGA